MKKTIAVLLVFCAAAAIFSAHGCSRPPAASTVEFRGRVYYGVTNPTSGVLTVIGPLPAARVVLMGDNYSVTTDAAGGYTLVAEVQRSFTANNRDQYTLEAVSPVAWSGTSERQAVTGRPGDVIYVRDFVLHKHYEQAQ